MRRTGSSLLALGGAFLLAGAALAEQPVAIDELFEAAGRGEVAPIERALAGESRPDVRAVLRAGLAAARLDPRADDDPELARLAGAESEPALRRAALGVLMSSAFLAGDYAEAARTGRRLEQALAAAGDVRRAAEVGRTRSLAELLADHPPQSVEGEVVAGAVPIHYDRVGLPRIEVTVNGQAQEAVVDTGANLSVLSLATAQRLGVRVLDAETSVGNGVEGTVPVRIGVAERMEVAGTVLRNVAVLVIDDSQLTFPLPGGYDIRAIVGLPVLHALGRIRIENAGRFVVEPGAAGPAAPANLRASGNDLFVDVAIAGDPVPLHLDTGANLTRLTARYAAARPQAVAGLETAESRTASAGGARETRVATWPRAPLTIAGRDVRLPELTLELPTDGAPPRFYGTLGSNALRAFQSYTIDFAAMRLDLGPPATETIPAP